MNAWLIKKKGYFFQVLVIGKIPLKIQNYSKRLAIAIDIDKPIILKQGDGKFPIFGTCKHRLVPAAVANSLDVITKKYNKLNWLSLLTISTEVRVPY